MNKKAYETLMRLNKSAADKPVMAPVGTVPGANPANTSSSQGYMSTLDFVKSLKPEEGVNKLRSLMRDYGAKHSAPGELSFWEKLWETIKSWFGNDAAKSALARHSSVLSGREESKKNLSQFIDKKIKKLEEKDLQPFQGIDLEEAASRAIPRATLAGAHGKIMADKYKFTPQLQAKVEEYLKGRGEQNRGQLYAPKALTVPEGLSQAAKKDLEARGRVMTKIPSYRDQLSGNAYA